MRKTTVIIFPTVNMAVYKWKAFLSRWSSIIKKASRSSLCIELSNGHEIYFKGEIEREKALRGIYADVIIVDEFEMSKTESEDVDKSTCNEHDLITDFTINGKIKQLSTCDEYDLQESEE